MATRACHQLQLLQPEPAHCHHGDKHPAILQCSRFYMLESGRVFLVRQRCSRIGIVSWWRRWHRRRRNLDPLESSRRGSRSGTMRKAHHRGGQSRCENQDKAAQYQHAATPQRKVTAKDREAKKSHGANGKASTQWPRDQCGNPRHRARPGSADRPGGVEKYRLHIGQDNRPAPR